MNFISLSSPLASMDWWDVFWWLTAGAGGVIVFWGLWQEKKYEKESYLNVEDFRACKSKRTRGWRILMVGIAAEIALGFGHALKDALETRQIKITAGKNDTLNRPISDISASLTILMRTKETGLPPFGPQPDSTVALLENGIGDGIPRTVFLGGFQTLLEDSAQGFTQSDSTGSYVGYSIQFRVDRLFSSSPQNGFVLADYSAITPKHILSKIEALAFQVVFIPKDAEIVSGSAEILVNGTFRKEFQIFNQKLGASGSFYATNSVPNH